MKTREIKVWISERGMANLKKGISPSVWGEEDILPNLKMIECKLLIPAEPEVLEFEADHSDPCSPAYSQAIHHKLSGRRWKIVATEIIENESLNLK